MFEGCSICKPGADRVQSRGSFLGSSGSLRAHEQRIPFASIVDGLYYNAAAIGARYSDCVDRARQPFFRFHCRDLIKEVHGGSSVVFRISNAGQLIDRPGLNSSYMIRLPAGSPARQSYVS